MNSVRLVLIFLCITGFAQDNYKMPYNKSNTKNAIKFNYTFNIKYVINYKKEFSSNTISGANIDTGVNPQLNYKHK